MDVPLPPGLLRTGCFPSPAMSKDFFFFAGFSALLSPSSACACSGSPGPRPSALQTPAQSKALCHQLLLPAPLELGLVSSILGTYK